MPKQIKIKSRCLFCNNEIESVLSMRGGAVNNHHCRNLEQALAAVPRFNVDVCATAAARIRRGAHPPSPKRHS